MKKAFTLIEVTAVVVLLSIIAVLVIPKVSTSIGRNKEKIYNSNVNTIVSAAEVYLYNHVNIVDEGISDDGYFDVSLLTLIEEELVPNKIENPYGGYFDTSDYVRIEKDDNIYTYEYRKVGSVE